MEGGSDGVGVVETGGLDDHKTGRVDCPWEHEEEQENYFSSSNFVFAESTKFTPQLIITTNMAHSTTAVAPSNALQSTLNSRGDRVLRHQTDFSDEPKRKAPNWSRFVGSKGEFLNRQDQDVISQYERQPNDSVQELLDTEKNGNAYANTLFKVRLSRGERREHVCVEEAG